MATYNGFTRTNYFSVTDEDMLRDIVDRIVWDNDDGFFEDRGGKFAFGSYGSVCGLRNAESENDSDSDEAYDDDCDDEYEADAVYEALQSIVAPDDAIIITEIGYEKLRYLEKTMDYKGENHYEETNSIGPECAPVIAEAFKAAIQSINP